MCTTDVPYKNVQQYLDAIGILEEGSAAEITAARKTFRKLYLQQYRKRYAKTHSSVNIAFTATDKQLLKQIAIDNSKKLASYIKELALSVAHGEHPVSQMPVDLSEIKRLFSLCFDMVETLQFENEYPELKTSYDTLEGLFKKIELLLNDY